MHSDQLRSSRHCDPSDAGAAGRQYLGPVLGRGRYGGGSRGCTISLIGRVVSRQPRIHIGHNLVGTQSPVVNPDLINNPSEELTIDAIPANLQRARAAGNLDIAGLPLALTTVPFTYRVMVVPS